MSLQDVPKGTPIENTTYWVTLDSMVPSETPTGQERLTTPDTSELDELSGLPISNINNGMVAYYPFDGNAQDMSGNENHGIVIGAKPTSDRYGNYNMAYAFDGVDDYIKLNNPKILGNIPKFSIFTWVKLASENNTFISKHNSIYGEYNSVNGHSRNRLRIFGNQIALNQYFPAGGDSHSNEINSLSNPNSWTHIGFVRDASNWKFYANGEINSYGHDAENYLGKTPNISLIGARSYSYQGHSPNLIHFFAGSMDSLRLYNRPLSPEEAKHLFDYEKPSLTSEKLPTPPQETPGTPPADDYKETIAALKKQIEKLTANLEEANRQIANKDETIYELEDANQELIKQNEELSKKLAGEIEKNDVLYAQVNNLTHERDNLTYELNLSKKQADEAVRMAQIPFINGWVYDNDRGWIFTDAEHYPMVYTHKDNTWHYFELGSNPRYFFNFTSQQWEAWDDLPEENDQNVASNDNF